MRGKFLLGIVIGVLAVLGAAAASSGGAEATPPSPHCGNVHSIEGTADLVTYDASPGYVGGLCIKSGRNMWGGNHSPYFQGNGVIYVNDQACYHIAGVGTSVVTVTRLGEGRLCQGISHIDLLKRTPEHTPTPTPTSTPTPTPTPTTTPTITPTPTTTPSTTATPIPTPTVTPTDTRTPAPETVTPTTTPTATGVTQAPQPVSLPVTGGPPECGEHNHVGLGGLLIIAIAVGVVFVGGMALGAGLAGGRRS